MYYIHPKLQRPTPLSSDVSLAIYKYGSTLLCQLNAEYDSLKFLYYLLALFKARTYSSWICQVPPRFFQPSSKSISCQVLFHAHYDQLDSFKFSQRLDRFLKTTETRPSLVTILNLANLFSTLKHFFMFYSQHMIHDSCELFSDLFKVLIWWPFWTL